ncbi:MAG: 3-methyl-2-oxobutanoate hydroxymethyltransferase [Deltaproteobacteria bacterium]|nr:3-methyl-2-oxobutanoate hydroxymethyltransferase [Deltaproteobacteria bacterium]
MERTPIDIPALQQKKANGEKITMLTAYDAAWARLLDEAGVDTILVGDSAANVVLGYRDTLPVTMDEMIALTRAVSRGTRYAMVLGDMPFLSYQSDVRDAILNAGRFLKEGGAVGVKIEGGAAMAETVRALVRAGIPTVGHLGLTPQTASMIGGYRCQGRTAPAARQILDDALLLQDAGAFLIVLECIPDRVAAEIARRCKVPIIGIGAGAACDGQVLVLHDMLGMGRGGHSPRFVRRFENLGDRVVDAVQRYCTDVRAGTYPAAEHAFAMPDDEWSAFTKDGKA